MRRSRDCGTAFESSPRDESVRLADADMSAHSKFSFVLSVQSVVNSLTF